MAEEVIDGQVDVVRFSPGANYMTVLISPDDGGPDSSKWWQVYGQDCTVDGEAVSYPELIARMAREWPWRARLTLDRHSYVLVSKAEFTRG